MVIYSMEVDTYISKKTKKIIDTKYQTIKLKIWWKYEVMKKLKLSQEKKLQYEENVQWKQARNHKYLQGCWNIKCTCLTYCNLLGTLLCVEKGESWLVFGFLTQYF